ncbi:MAG: luciferase [Halanaeroarchaeum sp.]
MVNAREVADRSRAAAATADRAGAARLDGIAIKPTEVDVAAADALPYTTLTIDYEGHAHVPDATTLERLATNRTVRVTVPVRADGYDPVGDDGALDELPDAVAPVFVAGNPAYLEDHERRRAVAPRLGRAVDRASDAWVGTEGVERLALATGATQFELLSRSTERAVARLRAAGFGGEVALYAPTVLTDDEDEILDAIGAYVARRKPVAQALPEGAATDSGATGRARSILLDAATDYALVGDEEAVGEAVTRYRENGVDTIVGYPARGLEAFVG